MIRENILMQYGLDHVIHSSIVAISYIAIASLRVLKIELHVI